MVPIGASSALTRFKLRCSPQYTESLLRVRIKYDCSIIIHLTSDIPKRLWTLSYPGCPLKYEPSNHHEKAAVKPVTKIQPCSILLECLDKHDKIRKLFNVLVGVNGSDKFIITYFFTLLSVFIKTLLSPRVIVQISLKLFTLLNSRRQPLTFVTSSISDAKFIPHLVI